VQTRNNSITENAGQGYTLANAGDKIDKSKQDLNQYLKNFRKRALICAIPTFGEMLEKIKVYLQLVRQNVTQCFFFILCNVFRHKSAIEFICRNVTVAVMMPIAYVLMEKSLSSTARF